MFNETVQMDLFYWESTWFMLLIDEATRFKKCGTIDGQEPEHLMKAILQDSGFTTLGLLNVWCLISKWH